MKKGKVMLKERNEKFYYEKPSLFRKEDAIDYVKEFYKYNSSIAGINCLDAFLNNYEEWLLKLKNDSSCLANEVKVPSETYFLVRENDDRIVGMTNIRLVLNDRLRQSGGHLGGSIRPTERKKGYSEISLYLALLLCQKYGISKAYINSRENNPGSWRGIEALGAKLINEYYDVIIYKTIIKDYIIDVDQAIYDKKDKYVSYLCENGFQKVKR